MLRTLVLVVVAVSFGPLHALTVNAQQPPAGVNPNQPATGNGTGAGFSGVWRSPTGEMRPAATGSSLPSSGAMTTNGSGTNTGLSTIPGAPRAPIAKVTSGTGTLPN